MPTKKEMEEAAEASVKRADQAFKDKDDKKFEFGKSRTRELANSEELTASDIPVPLDPANFGPTAFAATPVGDITGYSDSQEFAIDKDKALTLHFTKPGARLPKKPSYRIKAFHRDGRLVQLPFEPQIQNTASGSPEDAIGLRRYQNKGMLILIDWDTLLPIYCAAFDCWAKAREGDAFCCDDHRRSTLPEGRSVDGVTTARVWNG